ncbi:MAG: AAA-like domain-containing protein [Caldilineaceae bacterium]
MRYFNTHGPVNAQEHYVVPRQALVEQLTVQIEQGKFFTIYAPRQMGKTTLLNHLEVELRARPTYLPIVLSFELYESWSATQFWEDVITLIQSDLLRWAESMDHATLPAIRTLLSATVTSDIQWMRPFFTTLYKLVPTLRVVLIIDEFDATPQEVLSPLLQTWRAMYLERQRRPHSLHSVVLVGIQNIARLNFGRSSPFNIAYQHRLADFSLPEVRDLLGQYTAETGQPFAAHVVDRLHEQTAGQPFLVNRTAAILTEEVVQERTRPITMTDLRAALQKLVRESNYNFETVTRRATKYQDDLLEIIFGAERQFTLNNPMVKELHLFGILCERPDGNCQVANPIYKQVLIDYFTPFERGLQGAILANGYDFRPYVVNDQLQMETILSRFREFIERRGREAFKVTPMPQEATGQYLLMAYLDIVVRQIGGAHFTEVNSGEGRLDLVVVHKGRRYIIETKIWRGPALYDEGLTQLADYLTSEGQTTGYYVLFHARPNVYGQLPDEALEYTTQVAGKTIYVYLVRLGHLFEETPTTSQA